MLWRPGLTGRLAETLREEWAQLIAPIWPGIVAVAVLLLLAPARSRNNPALILCVASTTVYLLLPAICPFGPAWLVRFTVGRIVAAFVPLLATGVAMAWSDSGRLPRPAMAGLRAS
jgi:hypothetical protein